MKTVLAVFTAYLCCSFFMNMTRLSLTSKTSSTMLTSKPQEDTLIIGEVLRSKNEKFEVEMKSDCNLVITSTDTGKIIWSTNTKGMGVECSAIIQKNGIFVIKNKKNVVVWSSRSTLKLGGDGPYLVKITDAGNLTIEDDLQRSVWGALGLPLPVQVSKATKKPSQKNVAILLNFVKKIKKSMRNLPARPYGLYPKKLVKNNIPQAKQGYRLEKKKN